MALDAKGRVDMIDRASARWTASARGSGPSSTKAKATGTRARGALGAGALAGLTLASAGLVLAVPGLAAASYAKVVRVGTANVAHVGTVLTTGSGLTLYWFAKDTAGRATCTGGCAQIYPPYLATTGSRIEGPQGVKGLSLVGVGSGHWQVAFDHAPLYRFEGDQKKGQAKAQGAVGLWFVALKSGIKPATAAPQGGPPPSMPVAPAPAPAPPPAPTTAPPPPRTTPTTAPPTTTTTMPAGGGGGGVGF